jgi:2-C-methyl-D-erythritol 2,4-cyclodiphosphate synthase
MRIGLGFDIHPLVPGRKLILGGITIPHTSGLLGHSDADVVIHALCDALLGALGQGDIGEHFPDKDPKYKDISSILLLQSVLELMRVAKYQVCNLDVVILANYPKLSPYKKEIREKIAKELTIEENQVNIKASSTNGLPFSIRGEEGIGAWCVVLLRKEVF